MLADRLFAGRPGRSAAAGRHRDELLSRPALPMDVLGDGPRVLGGRDLVARGTWMAVGEQGVVAALTNRPPRAPGERPGLLSRGELPLRLARYPSARSAVDALSREVDPSQYNPCWVLVGDRESLFYLEVWTEPRLTVRELPPGLHILENRPLEAASPKVDFVRARLPKAPRLGRGALRGVATVLASREIPPAARRERQANDWRPLEVEAANVRAGAYGTRWSGIVAVGSSKQPPRFCFTNGTAGDAPFRRAAWPSAQ